MTDPSAPIVNPFTAALMALVALILFGWTLLLPGGAPIAIP
jgi:hypothetical protein